MTADPRGPIRTAVKVEVSSSEVRVTFECGCVDYKNPSRPSAWKIGDEGRAFGCKH